jgi:hypothetical protein
MSKTEKADKPASSADFDLMEWMQKNSVAIEFKDGKFTITKTFAPKPGEYPETITVSRSSPIEAVKALEEFSRLRKEAEELRQRAAELERRALAIQKGE